MIRLVLALLLAMISAPAGAAITYGSDYVSTGGITSSSLTVTSATLGSTGADSILFVEVESGANYNTPIAVDYNGVALTTIGGKITYSGSGTIYREFFYLNANLTSGQNIHVFSATTGTDLGNGGGNTWHIRYWTYGGVNGLGTTSVSNSNFTTSASGSPVATAFNFTPSSASSTIMQMLVMQGNTCITGYSPAFGTTRFADYPIFYGSGAAGLAMSDYAPGSTSLYSLSQSWNPNFCGQTSYGQGIELLDAGGGPTPTPSGPPAGSLNMMGCGL
jgi:hypothetical protein